MKFLIFLREGMQYVMLKLFYIIPLPQLLNTQILICILLGETFPFISLNKYICVLLYYGWKGFSISLHNIIPYHLVKTVREEIELFVNYMFLAWFLQLITLPVTNCFTEILGFTFLQNMKRNRYSWFG